MNKITFSENCINDILKMVDDLPFPESVIEGLKIRILRICLDDKKNNGKLSLESYLFIQNALKN